MSNGLGEWPHLQTYAYHWGIEVKFGAEFDEVFGITNDKQRVRPNEDFWRLMVAEDIDDLAKDVQGVMRHSRTATATDVYMQEIPASVQSTINSINSELRKSDFRSRKKSNAAVPTGAVVRSRRKPSSRVTPNDTKSLRGGSAQLPAYA